MSPFDERRTVQEPLIRYAEEAGWEYLPPEEALRLRRGPESPVLHEVLIGQLQRLNPEIVDLGRRCASLKMLLKGGKVT